jgi:hypothetical protein
MDMSRHLPRWINNTELQRLGGRYEGTVARVIEQDVYNRYSPKSGKQPEPVIVFADGYRLVPNITMRRLLVEKFGPDTDAWGGQNLIVVCRTLGGRDTKHLLFPDDGRPAWVTEHEGDDFTDAIGARDADDVEVER